MRGRLAEDLVGMRFGALTVIGRAENRLFRKNDGKTGVRIYWICKCDCGNEKEVRAGHLKSGKIISCGCIGQIHSTEAKIKHNQRHTRLYGVWCNMKNRCYNKNVRSYKDYGKRGIKVCDEWIHDFGAFSEWAFANGYDPEAEYGKCTIDRIDVDGDYCPENCRGVDLKIQANNGRVRGRKKASD